MSLAGDVTSGTGVNGEALNYTGATASDRNVATANKYISSITLTDATGTASNYQVPALNSANAPVTITVRTVTLSASKTYDGGKSLAGDVTIGTGVSGEALNYTGATASGANVATANKYISAITLSDATGNASNYQLPTLNSANAPVTITAKDIALTGFTSANKVYDSTNAATITAYGSLNGVLLADASLVRAGGGSAVFSDANAGFSKTVTGSGFGLAGAEAANYNLRTTTLNSTADITRRPLTVAADAKEKNAGQADPALTYQAERVSQGRGLLSGEILLGNLTRAAGETSGAYQIHQGTVNNAANNNYDVAFVPADLTIKNVVLAPEQSPTVPVLPTPIVIPPTAPAQPPPLPNPATGVTTTGRIETSTEGSSTSVLTPGGRSVSGGFVDAKPLVMAQQASAAFTYPIPESTFSHSNTKAVIALEARLADGSPLPAWMSFDPARKVITGTPPKGVAGDFQITITAKDQFGGEAQTSLKITVGI